MNSQLAAGSPATRPVDETCRRAQVVSLRSSRAGQEGSEQQGIKRRTQNLEAILRKVQGARHTEYMRKRFGFGPEPYALSLMPSPKAN